jgi:short-subunit dehydrogenase
VFAVIFFRCHLFDRTKGIHPGVVNQDVELAVNVNVTSTVHLAKRVLKDMVTRNQGRILITSSIAGQAPRSRTA